MKCIHFLKDKIVKMESRKTENLKNPIPTKGADLVIYNHSHTCQKQKRPFWLHWWMLPNISGKNNTNSHKYFQKTEERNAFHFILWGQYYPNTKKPGRLHKKTMD